MNPSRWLAAAAGNTPWSRWLRVSGALVGLALVLAACWTVVGEREVVGEALRAVRHPEPWRVLLLPVLVAISVVLSGLMFSVLIARYGSVGPLEMQALIAAAALLNFLPLRPGLFGRIAYHRAFNAIPAVATARTVLQALALSVAAAAYLAAAAFVMKLSPWVGWAAVGLPLPVLAAATVATAARRWALAALLRYVEVLTWALRYHTAFALIGSPIGPDVAVALASVSVLTMLAPLFGNGLGLREWAIGLSAQRLTPLVLELGLTAELLNRAAELVVLGILGLGAIAWLSWSRRRGAGRDAGGSAVATAGTTGATDSGGRR